LATLAPALDLLALPLGVRLGVGALEPTVAAARLPADDPLFTGELVAALRAVRVLRRPRNAALGRCLFEHLLPLLPVVPASSFALGFGVFGVAPCVTPLVVVLLRAEPRARCLPMVEVNTADSARSISERLAKDLDVIDFFPRNFGVLPPRREI
jgi:hypothetical protein